jgi:gas vesicle protein
MSENHSDLTVAFAFLAGALAGAGLALLLAPRPGTETRAQVSEWVKWLQEKAKDASCCASDEESEAAELDPPKPAAV